MRRVRASILFMVVMGGLIFPSCDKHSVNVPQSNDPVFRADGTIDSEPFQLIAGDDNAFMFTSIETDNNVPIFSGKLSNGNFSIELGIYDGMIDMPIHNILTSFPAEHIFSRKSTSPLAILARESFPNSDLITEVTWSLDGGPLIFNTLTIMKPGKYSVEANISFIDGSSSVLSSELIFGYARHANFHIKHFLNQNGTLSAWVEDPQVAIEKINWFLDDSLISTQSEFSFHGLTSTNHILRADVHFANGVKRTKNMLVDGSLSGKFIDDLSFFESGALSLINRDFNVRLKLEKNGVTYMSDEVNSSLNTVSFSEISYYGKDSNGEDVYKVKAHIVASVRDVQNVYGTKLLEFDTTFGLAIPEH